MQETRAPTKYLYTQTDPAKTWSFLRPRRYFSWKFAWARAQKTDRTYVPLCMVAKQNKQACIVTHKHCLHRASRLYGGLDD